MKAWICGQFLVIMSVSGSLLVPNSLLQLSEKDISLLEEKIRRYGKKPQTVTPAPSEVSTATTTAASSSSAGGQEEGGEKQKLKVPGSR